MPSRCTKCNAQKNKICSVCCLDCNFNHRLTCYYIFHSKYFSLHAPKRLCRHVSMVYYYGITLFGYCHLPIVFRLVLSYAAYCVYVNFVYMPIFRESLGCLNTTSPSTTNYYRLVAFFCRLCPRKLSTFLFRVGVRLFMYMALWECVQCDYLGCYSVRWCACVSVHSCAIHVCYYIYLCTCE